MSLLSAPTSTLTSGPADTPPRRGARRPLRWLGALLAAAVVGGCAAAHPPATVRELAGLVDDVTAPVGPEDGRIGERVVTVDDDVLAVTGLDPALRAALADATRAAARDGVELRVTSGWRSRAYQQYLLDEAIERYGSRAEARRWVSTPEESRHVTGDAVDVGPTDAAYWLSAHGADHGLCQTYANEIWHYELRVEPGGTCPAPAADGAS